MRAQALLAKALRLPPGNIRFDYESRCLELSYPLPEEIGTMDKMFAAICHDIGCVYDTYLQKPLAKAGFREAFPTRLDTAYRAAKDPSTFSDYARRALHPDDLEPQPHCAIVKWRMQPATLDKMVDALCKLSHDQSVLASIDRANRQAWVEYDSNGRFYRDAPLPQKIPEARLTAFADFMNQLDLPSSDTPNGPTPIG